MRIIQWQYSPFLYDLIMQYNKSDIQYLLRMVIYSGFSTRRQQQKYNQLIKDLIHLLSQMIITYIQSTKVINFRQAYQKIQFQITKMDQYKYSDIKISQEIQPLSQHILNQDEIKETFSQPPKRKVQNKNLFRMKRSNAAQINVKTIEVSSNVVKDKKRSTSMNMSSKNVSRFNINQNDFTSDLTMEQLMKMNPLVQRKMSGYRKKRYSNHAHNNNFPLIKEQDYQGQQKQ